MAKCIAVKMIGQNCEVAARADGVQFERKYGFNGYNNAWSKWAIVPAQFCVNFDANNMENLPRYRLPDCEAAYTRNTYYTVPLELSGLPIVRIFYSEDKYNDNNGAYEIAYGTDVNGNFTGENNVYNPSVCFRHILEDQQAAQVVMAILPEEVKEEIKMTYITPELIAQAQELIDKDMDYSYTASLPDGMALFSYEDGVWVTDGNGMMHDAVKIECVIAVKPGIVHLEDKDVVTRTLALCLAFGWQGGTIHQVAAKTGCEVIDLIYSFANRYDSNWSAGWCAYRTCSAEFNATLSAKNQGNLQFWLGVAAGVQTSLKMKMETPRKF